MPNKRKEKRMKAFYWHCYAVYIFLSRFFSGKMKTEKAKKEIKLKKIDNAIILAAGMSSRFVPFNYELPKGLLEVKGEVLIERQIRQLHEKGIHEIIIVVGYMKEKFEYLKEKYGVILVETDDYEKRITMPVYMLQESI